ncbi:zf-HC2 domain-containing protein [Embleya sp. NBC_00896]|uniref:anti-sigma factor family protein n=1 Tax=Embleya sp. NBC_00896 TaxID=2975961 RepID=UPI002F90A9AA|nr:zf-HC2 domain-containing protein [Embleya sp. NBC_00896]
MSIQPEHADVAAYALGVLEEADRDAFEEHLATCDRCIEELADFSGLATLLTEVRSEGTYELPELVRDSEPVASVVPFPPPRGELAGPERPDAGGESAPAAEPPSELPSEPRSRPESEREPAPVTDLAARRAARRAPRMLLMAAACVATLVLGLGAGLLTGGLWSDDDKSEHSMSHDAMNGPMQILFDTGENLRATSPETGTIARIGMENKAWGTHLGLELTNVRGPLRCSLVAVTRDGREQEISTWTVPPKGYGVPGSEAPLRVHTGTWVPRDQIARFDVRTTEGKTLVSVPA